MPHAYQVNNRRQPGLETCLRLDQLPSPARRTVPRAFCYHNHQEVKSILKVRMCRIEILPSSKERTEEFAHNY